MSLSGVKPFSIELSYRNEASEEQFRQVGSLLRPLKYLCLGPYKTVMAVWTLVNLKRYPECSLTEQAPCIQNWCEKAAYLCGYNPTFPQIKELHIPAPPFNLKEVEFPYTGCTFTLPFPKFPVCTSHVIKDSSLNKEILQPHRNVEFDGSSSSDAFFKLLEAVFPDTKFTKEDSLFTCGPDFTSRGRTSIMRALRGAKLDEIISCEGKELIERWRGYAETKTAFDVTLETRLFASGVITQAVLGQSEKSEELSKAVFFMNKYLFAKSVGSLIKGDKERFDDACATFRRIVDETLENDKLNPLILFQKDNEGREYTLAQKQAQIIGMFFAGQETTAFELDHIFAKLALYPSDQVELFNEIEKIREESSGRVNLLKLPRLSQFIDDRLLEIPPVNGIARRLKTDTILSYELVDSESKVSKFMRLGEKIVPQISSVAEQALKLKRSQIEKELYHPRVSIFGNGEHACPGKNLALKELFQLTAVVLTHFRLSTEERKFNHTAQVTNQASPFIIKLSLRANEDVICDN